MRVGLAPMVALATTVLSAASWAAEIELPPGPNRDLVYGRCRVCHDLQYVVDSAGITAGNWTALIEDMGRYGLRIPTDERDKIVHYLVTYLGTAPPKPPSPGASRFQAAVNGKDVYARQCSSCHQLQGVGIPRTFPPLAGNTDLFLDHMFPVYVVLNGLQGAATIAGEHYQGAMPPFTHLSDTEIAAVVNYVRTAWDNEALRPEGFADVTATEVGDARHRPMNAHEVHAYREARRSGRPESKMQ